MNTEVRPDESERPTAHLSPLARRKIVRTVALALLFVLVVAQQHLGFLALLLLIPFVIWLTWSAYVLVARPYLRKAQAIALAIWLVAIATTAWIHLLRYAAARADAETVVQSVRNYMVQHKRCPQDIGSANADRTAVPENLRAVITYECANNRPRLAYRATFTILDSYEADFGTGHWRYVSWAERTDFTLPGGR